MVYNLDDLMESRKTKHSKVISFGIILHQFTHSKIIEIFSVSYYQ